MKTARWVPLVALLAFAGCGNHSTSPQPQPTPLRTVGGHVCSPRDEALQCILPPVPRSLRPPPEVTLRHGVDFAWGAPSAARARALGASFAVSYLSHDASKGWTQRSGLLAEYRRAGIATAAVWETTAGRAGQGCGAGRTDAFYAARQAAALGNTDRPILFAVDFDARGSQVAGYFGCIHSILGDRTSAYGSYGVVSYLCRRHLVGRTNWQTYAWSGGAWLPAACAPLEQYLNDGVVDYDRALAADFGQWPGPAHPASGELEARRRALRRVLVAYGCRRRARQHEPLGPRCRRWYREGRRVNRELSVT